MCYKKLARKDTTMFGQFEFHLALQWQIYSDFMAKTSD